MPTAFHFSTAVWIPPTDELFAFDSCRPCGHRTVVQKVFSPVVDYMAHRNKPLSWASVKVVIKDETAGIARQPSLPPEESNVCGFAAVCFFGKALEVMLELADHCEQDPHSFTLALSAALHSMTIQSDTYKIRRRMGKNDLIRKCEEYRRYVRTAPCNYTALSLLAAEIMPQPHTHAPC